MMLLGDKGKILAGFHGEEPRLIPEKKMRDFQTARSPADSAARGMSRQRNEALALWVAAIKGGKPTYGDFLLAGPISDAFNLGAVSLRLGGKRLQFDSANGKVTNVPEANKYLVREYRTGWELTQA
jgi:hypothetical protein